jgi:hypothetical protein
MIFSQQLDRMAEADSLGLHHPVDSRPAHAASAQTVPQILRRSDDQRWRPVVMEGALAQEVRALPCQLDTPRLGQPLHRDFFL